MVSNGSKASCSDNRTEFQLKDSFHLNLFAYKSWLYSHFNLRQCFSATLKWAVMAPRNACTGAKLLQSLGKPNQGIQLHETKLLPPKKSIFCFITNHLSAVTPTASKIIGK